MRAFLVAALLAAALRMPLAAQDTTRVQPDDGWPDLSKFLDKPYGFVPIRKITEPAVARAAGA
jgi:hypothetical protein